MQKKGFTLVETLVVIALLAAISVTIGLSFSGMFDKIKKDDIKDFDKTIEDAGCLYAEKNDIDYDISIKIKSLIDQGLLRKDLIDPRTKENIKSLSNYCVTVSWKDNERVCTYSKEICDEYILPTVTDIKLTKDNNKLTAKIVAEAGTIK